MCSLFSREGILGFLTPHFDFSWPQATYHLSPLALCSEIAKTCIEVAMRLHFKERVGSGYECGRCVLVYSLVGVCKLFSILLRLLLVLAWVRAPCSWPFCIFPVNHLLHPLDTCPTHSAPAFPLPCPLCWLLIIGPFPSWQCNNNNNGNKNNFHSMEDFVSDTVFYLYLLI